MNSQARPVAVSDGVLEKERKRSEPRSVYIQTKQWDALDRVANDYGMARSV